MAEATADSGVYENVEAPDTVSNCSTSSSEDEYDEVRQGISNMIAIEKKLESLLWFHPYLTRHQAESILMSANEGVFLMRRRRTGWGTYSVDVRSKQSVKHFQATLTEKGVKFGGKIFPTAEDFADHFRTSVIIGDESGTVVECRHPYPREISEFDEYQDITCHFLVGRQESLEGPNQDGRIGLSAAAKEGYLRKKGGVVKNWKTRWFVLKGNQLAYYHDHRMKKSIRMLKLGEVKEVLNSDEEDGCLFKVVFSWRTFYLVAPTPQSRTEWVKLIEWKMKELQHQKSTNRLSKDLSCK